MAKHPRMRVSGLGSTGRSEVLAKDRARHVWGWEPFLMMRVRECIIEMRPEGRLKVLLGGVLSMTRGRFVLLGL
jgi:hypothetical protein